MVAPEPLRRMLVQLGSAFRDSFTPPEEAEPLDSASWHQARRYRLLLALAVLYLLWRQTTARATSSTKPWGPRWLAVLIGLAFSKLLSVVGRIPVKKVILPPGGIDAGRQYVVVWHPHGAYTTMAFMHCGNHSVQGKPLTWYPGIAPLLFNVPFFREAALLLNARSVTAKTLDKLAAAGRTVGVQPGGIPEQLHSDHTREIAFFPPKLGFIRLAMRHGVDLLPAYIFGENQAYTTYSLGRKISQWSYKWFGMPVVPITGRWGLPWLVPNKVDISVCWGRPVNVGGVNTDPTDAQVEEVFDRYVAELLRVFDENKAACLPPEVAAKGLTIVKRDMKQAKL